MPKADTETAATGADTETAQVHWRPKSHDSAPKWFHDEASADKSVRESSEDSIVWSEADFQSRKASRARAWAAVISSKMALETPSEKHRQKLSSLQIGALSALVARQLSRKEIDVSPGAKAAIAKEISALRAARAWDDSTVREFDDVKKESIAKGTPCHFARCHILAHVKGAELAESQQSYKGRLVYAGDRIRDEFNDAPSFESFGHAPAALAAVRTAVTFGATPGFTTVVLDAERAYLQAVLPSDMAANWIELPREAWLPSWGSYRRPVVRLLRPLYGHKLSGDFWSAHSEKLLLSAGFKSIQGWESCYYHERLGFFWALYACENQDSNSFGFCQNGKVRF